MNVKESHIVTGMSRDSAVSRQNPNLVYDAKNIRITTKDGNNSLLSVTNEKGTSSVTVSGIKGSLVGYAILNDYLILFTHQDSPASGEYKDYIFRLTMPDAGATVAVNSIHTVFQGDAGFSLDYPIQALPIYENDNLQKVYWVDGNNQPRFINIAGSTTNTVTDKLNFSRSVALSHTFGVTKYSTGGEFPVGTVQYTFSYYTKFGQESRLIDISPMYYLSPQEEGLDATKVAHCSFEIKVTTPDASFDYVRIYAIVRTQANAIPQCRVVGDYAIKNSSTPIVATDDGIKGITVPAASMYFIGGEELVAGTLAKKDNALFLGNIRISRPNVGDIKLSGKTTIRACVNAFAQGGMTDSSFYSYVGSIGTMNLGYSPDDSRVPTNATKYYDYNPNNNRSSYYIRRFKHRETYRLGFIAQYKNGQWSEPIWLGDIMNTSKPNVGAGHYSTGCFTFTPSATLVSALLKADYIRIAPVVVYPEAHERTAVMQGLLCPTMYNEKDRADNSPYAQSSWFFRLYHNGSSSAYFHRASIGGCGTPQGEIQCIDTSQQGMYYMDGNIVTFHSPDIECVDASQNTDLEGLNMRIVGFASASKTNPTSEFSVEKVTDHFLETENAGIRTDIAQIVAMRRGGYNIDRFSYPLYFDGVVANENNDQVIKKDHMGYYEMDPQTGTSQYKTIDDPACLWIVYPWHRSGSLNNQQALTTKQRSNGFNTRTAMLKRNITANAWFTNSTYFDTPLSVSNGIYTPKLFNYDQLASVKISAGSNSAIYYGNIDKVIISQEGKYPIYYGFKMEAKEGADVTNLSTWAEIALAANTLWDAAWYEEDKEYTGTDPVSMKYKSSPHIVIKFKAPNGSSSSDDIHIPMHRGDSKNLAFDNLNADSTGFGLWIAELTRSVDSTTRFGGKSEQAFITNNWIRCGDSKKLTTLYQSINELTIVYKQGDCYVQRYDCLKTYPFTNEDQNSVIETLSATLETYVNLDFRYDHNRGSGKNVALSPINFNLYNHLAYEQVNNFFTYHGLDYERYVMGAFPNAITWTLDKHFGEDIDTWASLDVSNMIELDGSKGEVTAIVKFRNDLYAFQKGAFAQLLYNSRVQIPTSDNTPIEITNGMKMQGVKYISEKVGCSNKWSIVETPLGIYFNDDELHSTYRFNGQLTDLTTSKGMRTFMQTRNVNKPWNPKDFDNCIAFYNKVGRDIYWIYDNACLTFSEQIDNYTSFMDYDHTPMMAEVNGNTFLWHGNSMHLMHGGDYNSFFGVHKPYWLTFISNGYPTENKIFNNVEWRDIVSAPNGVTKPLVTFDHIRVWNENQDTQSVSFTNSISQNNSRQPISYAAAVSNLRKKFNVWRCQIPRDKKAANTSRARISNPWCYIKLSRDNVNTDRHQLTDMAVDYFM